MFKLFFTILLSLFLFLSFSYPFSLQSKDPDELRAALFYYSQTKDVKYVKPICNILLNTNNKLIKITAAQALSNYAGNKEALNCLLRAYKKERDLKVKLSILNSLFFFKDNKVYEISCDILRNEKNNLLKKAALHNLINNPQICLKTLKNLLLNGTPEEKAFVISIFTYNNITIPFNIQKKFLNSGNNKLILATLNYMLYFKPNKNVLKEVKNIFENTYDPEIKEKSLEILLENSEKIDSDYLNFALSDENIREKLSYRLPFLKNKNLPLSTIKMFLEDQRDFVKISALTYIGNSGNSKYCAFLKPYFFKCKNKAVKEAYLWAISKLNCDYAPKYLILVISNMDNDDDLRLVASKYLKNIPSSKLEKYKNQIIYIYNRELLDDIKQNIKEVLNKLNVKN